MMIIEGRYSLAPDENKYTNIVMVFTVALLWNGFVTN